MNELFDTWSVHITYHSQIIVLPIPLKLIVGISPPAMC